ncbi:MAG: hypothetical protein ACYC36_02665 [Bellilinea sp.]
MTSPKWFKDFFTERDGTSWDLARFMGCSAFCELSYKFFTSANTDWQGFAIGIGAIMAGVAAKNFSEKENT